MKLHIAKRDTLSWQKQWAIRLAAIILAFVLCAIICMILTKQNPVDVYASLWKGAFGTNRKFWVTVQSTAVLLVISLALTPAFKMQFWNIGGEGQVIIGCLASAACMITLGSKLPNAALIPIMLVASVLAGAIWGLIPALLKAKWNTNETLSTLMMNYIATQIVAFFIIVWEVPKGSGNIGVINQQSLAGWVPNIFGNKYLLSIIVAVLSTAFMAIYLKYTKHGYEIAVVGESQNTARYVGISVEKVIIRTMVLSGGMCGLVGFVLVGGINHTLTTTIVGGLGFTAVMVSWLAKFNPVAMIATSLLIVFMGQGATEVAKNVGLNESFSDIMTGIILFFIIGCEFFIRYKVSKSHKSGKEA